MPDPTLQAAIREAYASAPADDIILHTLELRHESFAVPVRVVRDHIPLTAKLETQPPGNGQTADFQPLAFDFALPDVGPQSAPEIMISLDGVSGELIGYLDAAAQSASPIQVIYRPYLASDLSTPQMIPPLMMFIREVSADVYRVTCRASYGDLSNRKFPRQVYDTERFPGLISL